MRITAKTPRWIDYQVPPLHLDRDLACGLAWCAGSTTRCRHTPPRAWLGPCLSWCSALTRRCGSATRCHHCLDRGLACVKPCCSALTRRCGTRLPGPDAVPHTPRASWCCALSWCTALTRRCGAWLPGPDAVPPCPRGREGGHCQGIHLSPPRPLPRNGGKSTLLCDSPLCRDGVAVIKLTKSRKGIKPPFLMLYCRTLGHHHPRW